MSAGSYVVAFDTANEVIALALGTLDAASRRIDVVATQRIEAHRASNTKLLPALDALLRTHGIDRNSIACVACGRGPGSFTGVRICIATAKGMACGLEVPLIGVSTLDALAWELHASGVRGPCLVVADAMRKEVYPLHYNLAEDGPQRRGSESVAKAYAYAQALGPSGTLTLCGDALSKYADLFAGAGSLAPEASWTLAGPGLLAALEQMWREGAADPFDAARHDPALVLPVYTRLSDAEENERTRLADGSPRDLRTGVQAVRMQVQAGQESLGHHAGAQVVLRPLDAAQCAQVGAIEGQAMGADAWSASMFADDIAQPGRSWWVALDAPTADVVGYAGGMVADGCLDVLKVACAPAWRRQGIARALLSRVANDARDLGACSARLEVRASNEQAQAFYRSLGFTVSGMRPGYYSDGEDALLLAGPLPVALDDVAGMHLQLDQAAEQASGCPASTPQHPLILAFETSCDETAAAVVDGSGAVLADTVASQIDFHARFGGVVPEIASRKHIEAICGVSQVCLEHAALRLGRPALRMRDLDAIAVTYAPGLVGALVVGVAFAKAAAWACDIPLVGVNHLEGHLYANKMQRADLEPPMVVSLVSGGHTMLVHVRHWGDYEVLGSTIDDAVGEAFDKVAKALGLGYPGGPVISRLAASGNPHAIDFPRAMMHSGDLRFSLSGLKTAVISYINAQRDAGVPLNVPDVAASFQAAVVDVQVSKAMKALEQTGALELCVGGGVAANPGLRDALAHACSQRGVRLTVPPLSACTDNAAMIGLVAIDRFAQGRFFDLDADAFAHAALDEPY